MTTRHTPTPDLSPYTLTPETLEYERLCEHVYKFRDALQAIAALGYKPSEGRTLDQAPETLDRVIGIARAALAKVEGQA